MAEEREPTSHEKLYGYAGMCVVGIIVLVLGIQQLSWIISVIGLFVAGFGGFETKFTWDHIQFEEMTLRANQSGQGNTQVNANNPQHSPTIGRVDHYYAVAPPEPKSSSVNTGETPKDEMEIWKQEPERKLAPTRETRKESEDDQDELEELCSGQIHFEDFEEFQTEVSKGDRVAIQISAEHPVSVQIMNDDDFDSFDSDSDDNEVYWKSPNTTNYGSSWTAKKRENVHILVVNETDMDEWDNEEAVATMTINAVRKKHGNDG